MRYYTETEQAVLEQLGSDDHGLSRSEHNKRLKADGLNQIKIKGVPLWRKIIEPFANVFMAVLFLAAVLSLVSGHKLDAVIILVIILVSAIIYYVQQFSTDRVLRALKRQEAQEVSVMLDGKIVKIASEEIVKGDIILLSEGEKVPADIRLIQAENVAADEAMLTGESLPIEKDTDVIKEEKPIYERTNMLFQGSFVVSGQATGVVVGTALETEFGRLAELAVQDPERSPVQRKIDELITKLIIAVTIVVVVVFALEMYRGIEIFEAIRFVLALAVSAVPEGLPIAVTVILVLGMRRMARYKSLARSMRAIEAIGIVTAIASDKTGTLTKNKLSVQKTWANKEEAIDPSRIHLSLIKSSGAFSDPLDKAFAEFLTKAKFKADKDKKLVTSLSFDQKYAMSGNVWKVGKNHEVYLKGAPERIIKYSFTAKSNDKKAAEAILKELTSSGHRVIAIGSLPALRRAPESFDDLALGTMKFEGLVAVADELRPEASAAISAAQAAGIKVCMITGDHAETAYNIGKQLGLAKSRDEVMDCRTIGEMSDRELTSKIKSIRVFARVIPEAKHRILTILKKSEIVAMTGDGVNDVPALANAHVGIAMGSGSQIAKESGDIVLLDDNFASIIKAVEGGRVIYANIRRIIFHILGTSLGEVLVMIGALLIGLPLPLVAVQILWVNLVTDTTFEIPLGLEPAEEDVMKQPPRRPDQPILDGDILVRFLLVATSIAALTLGAFWYFLDQGVDYARTIAFTVLAVTQWANAINARSELASFVTRLRVKNWAFVIGFSLAVILQLIVLFGPLAGPLHVVPVDLVHLGVASLGSFVVILIVAEIHKFYCRQKLKNA